MLPIRGLHKTTLVDYPGKVACTVFIGGCNFRCGFCYNADVVFNQADSISQEELFSFLKKRKKVLDGVCITGGEPTLYKELVDFCKKIKELGYAVKLDTNGTNPELVKKLIDKKLIDYVAMDIKGPLEDYDKINNVKVNTDNIKTSIQLLTNSNIDYEFRTTLVPDTINEESIKNIGKLIKGAKRYFLQQFRPENKTIDKRYNKMKPLPLHQVERFKQILEKQIEVVEIRK